MNKQLNLYVADISAADLNVTSAAFTQKKPIYRFSVYTCVLT